MHKQPNTAAKADEETKAAAAATAAAFAAAFPSARLPCGKSHITRHTSHITRHTSHVTRHSVTLVRRFIQAQKSMAVFRCNGVMMMMMMMMMFMVVVVVVVVTMVRVRAFAQQACKLPRGHPPTTSKLRLCQEEVHELLSATVLQQALRGSGAHIWYICFCILSLLQITPDGLQGRSTQ